jgi:hypothetical protein
MTETNKLQRVVSTVNRLDKTNNSLSTFREKKIEIGKEIFKLIKEDGVDVNEPQLYVLINEFLSQIDLNLSELRDRISKEILSFNTDKE